MIKKVTVAIAAILSFSALYYVADPAHTWWMPHCPLHRITGWSCPVCGFQRGVHALLHGQWLEALQFNWFLFGLSPFFLLMFCAEVLPCRRYTRHLQRWFCSNAVYAAVAIAALAWTVIRNILHI